MTVSEIFVKVRARGEALPDIRRRLESAKAVGNKEAARLIMMEMSDVLTDIYELINGSDVLARKEPFVAHTPVGPETL